MTAPVTLEGVGHRFGEHRALGGIGLEIAAGDYVTLLGPSGCGKTTLLSILGGFLRPEEGRVRIGGRDVTAVPPARRPTATVFQDYALFPHMTLRDNVGFGPRMAGMGRVARHRVAEEKLALVGLAGAGGKRPHELSGGQRQRVALARALAVEPDVLLLDEPLGALDLKLRRAMQEELKALQRRVGTTFVHVTHDQEEAMAIADRVVVMNAGRIEDEGPPDRVYRRPRSLFAAGFMGETNRIPGRRGPGGLETPLGPVPLALPGDAARVVVCLRPESLKDGAGDWDLGPARVEEATFLGAHVRARLVPERAPELRLVAHLPPGWEPGAALRLAADPADLSVFPEETP
ncbi:ABC transporter ATP-binding protein [Rubellimicrobium aerolatum]|uniref:ABC transporter ATP-binding protein n=1 Tax=Rubellimicrobium aerolatum TaxID=490979 RepID=A0ABW0SE68_9RHOB|nr:ABC transporter ATP-binding protein [Rubellimicrobium aerolatum]MBP1806832.1 spermidine/putrescine transport system ATP-binding protein [Rubellimicrobium aerolatum]